jgi:hypothetical protein
MDMLRVNMPNKHLLALKKPFGRRKKQTIHLGFGT